MSLKNLTDNELAEFIKDPSAFLKDKKQFEKAFGLHDPDLRSRVEKVKRDRGLVWPTKDQNNR